MARPRLNAKDELIRVRALYLDIAQWATEEPGRWAQWAVPSPVSDAEINWAKERRRRKARMDRRTRERLPVPPVLTRTAAERKNATARQLQAAMATPPGEIIEGTSGALRRAVAPKANGRHVRAEDTATGKRRNLTYEEAITGHRASSPPPRDQAQRRIPHPHRRRMGGISGPLRSAASSPSATAAGPGEPAAFMSTLYPMPAPAHRPAQRPRLASIRDSLTARIAEAEREGWTGEAEGLKVSLAAEAKLAQAGGLIARRAAAVGLGIPACRDIAAQTSSIPAGRL